MRMCCLLAVLCLSAVNVSAQETNYPPLEGDFDPPKTMNELPLVFEEDFEAGKANRWEPTDKSAWTIKDQGGNKVYALTKKKSDFNPPVRSPFNRSLVKGVDVESFVFDVKLQSTHPDYGHRDLCLFFGYQDDSHFYYVHFGKKTDDHANQIFIVNESPRKKVSTKTTPGTVWDDEWHHARIVRDAETGKIEVFFDDMKNPVMTAVDKTFTTGRVGVGSFDDTGQFDQIALYGNKVANKQAELGKVSGTVTLDGKPLPNATVTFQPETGRPSVGVTDVAGSFVLRYTAKTEGAQCGKHRVMITTKRGAKGGKELIPAQYNEKTSLAVEIESGENQIDFDLKSE